MFSGKLCTLLASATLIYAASSYAQTEIDHCQTRPVRSDALDWPSRHAWNLFVWLNHPAIDKKVRRGVPDCSKPVGSPGTTAVWETWRNAASEVFLPNEPPEWNDNSLPDEKPGTVPKGKSSPVTSVAAFSESPSQAASISFHQLRGTSGSGILFSPDDGVFSNSGGFGETRLNKVTYDFVRDQCLYNRQGLERYAKAISGGKKPPILLPTDSIEVKAAWIDFSNPQGDGSVPPISAERRKSYYAADYNGKQYGLVALHFLTKDTPNWFWASFHHMDTPKNQWQMPDTYGQPKVLRGTVWENYLLAGAQIDFVTPEGKPTILSDHFVEFGFQKSSCITCHATATIATTYRKDASTAMPAGQTRAVCLLGPNQPPFSTPASCKRFAGIHLFKVKTDIDGKPMLDSEGNLQYSDDLVEERGSPLNEWYMSNGKLTYFQTDFLYSIPFRAGKVDEVGSPPDRCVW
jgi:hypothetical protein